MTNWACLLLSSAWLVTGQDLFLPWRTCTKRPNLVWFLTDDQDQVLGGSFPPTSGATPMPRTRQLMQDEGAHATRWYIHTPICSPSRSELLTGRYFHNVKRVGGEQHGGMHVNYTIVNQNHFVKTLHDVAGYATGLFGKYLNVMPATPPAGFDAWFANSGGTYIAPSFQTKNIAGLPDGHVHFSNDPANYSTTIIGNMSVSWIKKVAEQGRPFLAYIAPKAAHEPYNPAPWYRDHWDPSWPQHEPRPENWNCSFESRKYHHGNIATEPLLTEQAARIVTGAFKNRWRTLMSIDDLISEIISTVDMLGLKDCTYFLYSSDHGFQLGEFNILMDKRHVYEWDTKIHLLARGPGIPAGHVMDMPGTQVDIAPTLLGLAGLHAPPSMDGRSIVPFLVDSTSSKLPVATREHLNSLQDLDVYRSGWRQEVFLEFYYYAYTVKCTLGHGGGGRGYPFQDTSCADLANHADCWSSSNAPPPAHNPSCYTTEDPSNNYIALRQFGPGKGRGKLYAEFQRGDLLKAPVDFERVDFIEHFDLESDPWELRNLARDPASAGEQAELHKRLHQWLHCSGSSCP